MSNKQLILIICEKLGLFHLTKFLYRKHLQILCYHGFSVTDESDFRPQLFINEQTFIDRLRMLKQAKLNIIPLNYAINNLDLDSLPNNSLVITIDDGFYNVRKIAAPILSEFNFPSTLYLTTYYCLKQTPIFRLLIQYLFWKTNKQDIDLKLLELEPFQYTLNLSDSDIQNQVAEIYDYCEKQLTDSEHQDLCLHIADILEVDISSIINNRILGLITLEEAEELRSMGMDIQLHTHRHILPQNNEFSAKREVTENRKAIEEKLSGNFKHFCYPSGQWNKCQWPWLNEVGIVSATTCEGGFNRPESHKLCLSRFLDGENISEIEFKAEIYGFLELMRNSRAFINKYLIFQK